MKTKLNIYIRRKKIKKAKTICVSSKIRFNEYKRVYHFHVRKSAGTSVNAAFWELGGLSLGKLKREPIGIGKNIVYVRNNKELIEGGNYHFANSHIPFWNLDLPQNTFTFCFIREPYDRLVSLYRYYKWVEDTPFEARKNDPYFYSLKKYSHWVGNCFSDFLDNLPKKHLMNQLYMFSENFDVDEARNNIEKVSAVYFQSNFNKSLSNLSQLLNIELSVKKERKISKNVLVNITDLEKNKAMEYLKLEYEFYSIVKSQYELE